MKTGRENSHRRASFYREKTVGHFKGGEMLIEQHCCPRWESSSLDESNSIGNGLGNKTTASPLSFL